MEVNWIQKMILGLQILILLVLLIGITGQRSYEARISAIEKKLSVEANRQSPKWQGQE